MQRLTLFTLLLLALVIAPAPPGPALASIPATPRRRAVISA